MGLLAILRNSTYIDMLSEIELQLQEIELPEIEWPDIELIDIELPE